MSNNRAVPAYTYTIPEVQADVPDPGSAVEKYIRYEPIRDRPFLPTTGFAGNTGGKLKKYGGKSTYGNTRPPTITPESLLGQFKWGWGRTYYIEA